MRENCTQFENTSSTDPGAVDLQIPTMFGAYSSADFITINWQLSYSGRSPLKYLGADLIVRPKRLPYNETDYKKAQEHDSAELWSEFFFSLFPIMACVLTILTKMV
jgi:hypothetical protein